MRGRRYMNDMEKEYKMEESEERDAGEEGQREEEKEI
jgi:hypothetical protein